MGLDMKPFLDSSMAYYQIDNAAAGYPDYHPNPAKLVVPSEMESTMEIEENYETVIGKLLEENTIKKEKRNRWKC